VIIGSHGRVGPVRVRGIGDDEGNRLRRIVRRGTGSVVAAPPGWPAVTTGCWPWPDRREVLPFLPLMRDTEKQVAGPSVMNNLQAGLVLLDMRIHRQNGPSGAPAGREDYTTETLAGRLDWRPRRRRGRRNVRRAPGSGTAGDQTAPGDQTAAVRAAPGETVAVAMQLAIALLTAGLDSPKLHEVTGEPPAAILQRWRSWRSTGGGHPPSARTAPPAWPSPAAGYPARGQ
jgi:hypothetical protein